MEKQSTGLMLIGLLLGVLAVGNYALLPAGGSLLYFIGAPLLVAIILIVTLPRLIASDAASVQDKPSTVATPKPVPPPAPVKPSTNAAVQLLALLQRDGRLVDFLREDIQPYDDAQIGAAVRTIHESCRQVLTEHLSVEPVLSGQEGDEVSVPEGFDPSAIRLIGNVSGEPPFRGVLRHAGWRTTQVKLPHQPSGQDPKIVAPAEVEIV
jgi:hypothetical protein